MLEKIENILERLKKKRKKLINRAQFLDIVRVPDRELVSWYNRGLIIFNINKRKEYDEEEILEVVYMIVLKEIFTNPELKRIVARAKKTDDEFIDIYRRCYMNKLWSMRTSEFSVVKEYIEQNIVNPFKNDLNTLLFVGQHSSGRLLDDSIMNATKSNHPFNIPVTVYESNFRKKLRNKIKQCPFCGKPSYTFKIVYYSSPPITWKMLCGRAGTMLVCPKCKKDLYYKIEFIN
jgi:hypothetical protein